MFKCGPFSLCPLCVSSRVLRGTTERTKKNLRRYVLRVIDPYSIDDDRSDEDTWSAHAARIISLADDSDHDWQTRQKRLHIVAVRLLPPVNRRSPACAHGRLSARSIARPLTHSVARLLRSNLIGLIASVKPV